MVVRGSLCSEFVMGDGTEKTDDPAWQIRLKKFEWINGFTFSSLHIHQQKLDLFSPVWRLNLDRLNPSHALKMFNHHMSRRKGRTQRRTILFSNRSDFAAQSGGFQATSGRLSFAGR